MSNLNTHGVTDYVSAMKFMQGKDRGRGPVTLCYETVLRLEQHPSGLSMIEVCHHGTGIIRYWSDGTIDIRTGGWLSVTTVSRLHNMTPREVRVSRAKGGSVRTQWGSVIDHVPMDWATVVLPTGTPAVKAGV